MIYSKGLEYFPQPDHPHLRSLLQSTVREHGDALAYQYREKPKQAATSKSYAEFWSDVQLLGQWLWDRESFPKKEAFAIMGDNSYAWVVSSTATVFGLGLCVPLDKQLAAPEVAQLCERARVRVFFYDKAHATIAQHLQEVSTTISHYVLLDHLPSASQLVSIQHEKSANASVAEVEAVQLAVDPDKVTEAEPVHHTPKFEHLQLSALYKAALTQAVQNAWLIPSTADASRYLLKEDLPFAQLPLEGSTLAGLFFTSGTTNQSKGVLLTHRNIYSNLRNGLRSLGLRAGQRTLSILPIHHTFENTVGLYAQWLLHNCVCYNDGLRYFSYNLQDWKIEMMLGVPLLLENMHKQINNALHKSGKTKLFHIMRKVSRLLRSLGLDLRRKFFQKIHQPLGGHLQTIIAGAAPLAPELITFFDDIGIQVYLGYGLTEASPMIAANSPLHSRLGSVGRALTDVEIRIDKEEAAEEDQVGEVLARGENIFQGYFEDPENTALAIDSEGWLYTGDLGYFDKDGYLYLTGRKKSMIVLTNGKKVFPEEIEQLLASDDIQAAFVWGEENSRGAIDICASLQLNSKGDLAQKSDAEIESELRHFLSLLNEKIPVYKAIRYFLWSKEGMPMTTTLKVRRKKEQERIQAFLQQEGKSMREADGRRLQ